jgi:hypothetical protein
MLPPAQARSSLILRASLARMDGPQWADRRRWRPVRPLIGGLGALGTANFDGRIDVIEGQTTLPTHLLGPGETQSPPFLHDQSRRSRTRALTGRTVLRWAVTGSNRRLPACKAGGAPAEPRVYRSLNRRLAHSDSVLSPV